MSSRFLRAPRLAVPLLVLLAATPLARAQAPAPASPKKAAAELPPFEVAKANETGTIWFGRFGVTNCAWIDMGDGVFVIDTGASVSDGANLAAQIKEKTKGKPIKWFALTHLHGDSNSGLQSFIPTDATVFVNAKVMSGVAAALGKTEAPKKATVIGVTDHLFVTSGTRVVEVAVPAGPAHTDHDLYVIASDGGSRIAFVGDLLTTSRCPMLSDPNTDPKGWLAALDALQGKHPTRLIPTRGDGTEAVDQQLEATRGYLKRLLEVVTEVKKKNYPEARVSGELAARKITEYCPTDLDMINGLALFRRMQPNGTLRPGSSAPQAPAPKRTK